LPLWCRLSLFLNLVNLDSRLLLAALSESDIVRKFRNSKPFKCQLFLVLTIRYVGIKGLITFDGPESIVRRLIRPSCSCRVGSVVERGFDREAAYYAVQLKVVP
jgi:hypothetical protein